MVINIFCSSNQKIWMTHLSLSFLGGFQVTLDAKPITAFESDKVRSLLAYLVVNSERSYRRSELTAMFWSDSPPKKAAHNLSQSILRLRRVLGEKENSSHSPFLLISTQAIQFNPTSDYQLDISRFTNLLGQASKHTHVDGAGCAVCIEWLSQAVELYQGDLLSGLFMPDSAAFEEWRLVLQEVFHGQVLAALRQLTSFFQARGEWVRVQTYARRQIALEPWREEAHVQLMDALVQSGQLNAALRQFEQYRRILNEELGIRPSIEITRLYEQIRSGGASGGKPPKEDEASWLSTQGERRQITVLICSRGNQRLLLENLEDAQEQMAYCEQHCERIFHRFGGQRARRLGDACLVYFGFPKAYEDAARRAVHSGMAITHAQNLVWPARIAIHTGVVVVGEPRGNNWQDRDLVGNVFDVTRNYHQLAEPGGVLVSEDTRRLVQEFFHFELLHQPDRSPSNSSESMPVYRVIGENNVQSRLEWLARTQHLTAFSGRETEIDRLRACYQRLLRGIGQVVLLRGEPGIGKSRLVWEFQRLVMEAPTNPGSQLSPTVLWLTSQCQTYDQNTSLFPVIGLLGQLCGFQPDDSRQIRNEKLLLVLDQYDLNHPATVWLLSLFLGLIESSTSTESVMPAVTNAQRKQMHEVLFTIMRKVTHRQSLILVIEDMHWCDPSTLEWIGEAFSLLASIPCLILLTARPNFQPTWLVQPNFVENLLVLGLQPLLPEQAEEIVLDLVGEYQLAPTILRKIVEQTDGNPLFIEELTKTLLERSLSGEGWRPDTEIPITLRDSLAARLDHLGIAKETAQWAAVLGREFTYPVLQACVPYDQQRTQNDLARLIEYELITPVQDVGVNTRHVNYGIPGASGSTRYVFKHILVQEAAYSSLLKRTRQVYHRRIAETLEHRFPQMVETRPEVLAQHYTSAGMITKAVDYWLMAGQRATAQGATLEVIMFLDRAIEMIGTTDPERRWQALL
jgi:DNA-binding SARP family transcriptional activator